MRRKTWLSMAAVAALLFAAFVIVTFNAVPAAADNTRWGANYFPNIRLINQDGKSIHFYDEIKGRIVVIDLIYTHCKDACPLETARLAQVQRLLGDQVGRDIFFYSISIDPVRDTPAQLKAYAAKYHVKPGWQFLTGNKADIDLLSQKLGLYSDPDPSNRDGHTPFVLLGNEATGQWIRNSALDNPKYLSVMIGDWLQSWKGKTRMADASATKSYAEATHIKLDKGQYLFSTHCAACHTVGQGDHIGPDLIGVTNVRSRSWLTRFIETPDKLLAQKDPIAVALFKRYKQVQMPNLRLGDAETAALIDYLSTQTNASQAEHSRSPEGKGGQ